MGSLRIVLQETGLGKLGKEKVEAVEAIGKEEECKKRKRRRKI